MQEHRIQSQKRYRGHGKHRGAAEEEVRPSRERQQATITYH